MQTSRDFQSLTVARVIAETPDARSFVFDVPSELATTFAYEAGQFCTFEATIEGSRVARCYSMSSSPAVGDALTVTVKRVPGGRMSNWMNDVLTVGEEINVLPPTGLFVLRPSTQPIVAFAGGSGITPILSIIKSALATTNREILLVYANRSPEDTIFHQELDQLEAESSGQLLLHHHFDAESGFLDAEACASLVGERTGGDVYICGPTTYMDVAEAGLAARGIGEDQVFIERFAMEEDEKTGESSDNSGDANAVTESMTIKLDGQVHTLDYQAGDTILEATRRAALKAPFSCEQGSCGTCMAQLTSGSATMRVNNTLTPAEVEDGLTLACQAIPSSREIVVDFDF